jgi:hypothetical protein
MCNCWETTTQIANIKMSCNLKSIELFDAYIGKYFPYKK